MFTFFDFETTDKTPVSEILTGHFITTDRNFKILDTLSVKARPELYIDDSFEIHKISKKEALSFPDKKETFFKIAKYLKKYKDGFFICHANGLVFGVYGYFDWQVLNNLALDCGSKVYFRFQYVFQNQKVISTHTIAKKLLKLDRYGLDDLASKFNIELNHHNAKSDTLVTLKIFKELMKDHKNLNDKELYDLGHWSGQLDFSKRNDGFM